MRPTAQRIEDLLAAGEGKTVEFKRGLQRNEKIARTLVAFANTRGGLLLVGIDDRGRVIGAPRPRETMRRLRDIAARHVIPALEVDLHLIQARERPVVCCSIPLSPVRPHAALQDDGELVTVIRRGSSNRVAVGATLEKLRAEQASGPRRDELELSVLAWVADHSRVDPRTTGNRGGATVADFAVAHRIGKQRARRVFDRLERKRLLIGHGPHPDRSYRRV